MPRITPRLLSNLPAQRSVLAGTPKGNFLIVQFLCPARAQSSPAAPSWWWPSLLYANQRSRRRSRPGMPVAFATLIYSLSPHHTGSTMRRSFNRLSLMPIAAHGLLATCQHPGSPAPQDTSHTIKVAFDPGSWYPHPELNRDQRFRKPPLYPFELWGQAVQKRWALFRSELITPNAGLQSPFGIRA